MCKSIGLSLIDHFDCQFDVQAVTNPDLSLNETAFADLEPLLLTPYFAFSYGVSFAILTSAVVTVLLWNQDTIFSAFSARKHPPDIHVSILERNYKSVPARLVPCYYRSRFNLPTFCLQMVRVHGRFHALGICVSSHVLPFATTRLGGV